jgi:hypothetical protein
MGSCSWTAKSTIKNIELEIYEHITLDQRTVIKNNLRRLNEERKKIFINKGKNAPILCLKSSLLYSRRVQQVSIT